MKSYCMSTTISADSGGAVEGHLSSQVLGPEVWTAEYLAPWSECLNQHLLSVDLHEKNRHSASFWHLAWQSCADEEVTPGPAMSFWKKSTSSRKQGLPTCGERACSIEPSS